MRVGHRWRRPRTRCPEEPDAGIPHVRICGSSRRETSWGHPTSTDSQTERCVRRQTRLAPMACARAHERQSECWLSECFRQQDSLKHAYRAPSCNPQPLVASHDVCSTWHRRNLGHRSEVEARSLARISVDEVSEACEKSTMCLGLAIPVRFRDKWLRSYGMRGIGSYLLSRSMIPNVTLGCAIGASEGR